MNQPTSDSPLVVTASGPYPPIRITRRNPYYAEMIISAIRAQSSELTAITTYLYQQWILPDSFDNLGKTLLNIAKVEMHHIQMLGQLVTLLGGDPKFSDNPCQCWSGEAVDYTQDIPHMLTANILSEKGAALFYQKTALNIRDPYVSAVLNRIAQDEILHAQIFEDYLDSYAE